jgi:hypothetical protein
MPKVIGLGTRGCGVAHELTDYPEYRVYKIGTTLEERGVLVLEEQPDIGAYEKSIDPNEVSAYLRSIKEGDDVLFVLGGGEAICGAALAILEQITHATITVLYICPDRQVCTAVQKRDDKIVFGVLQEYARSGMFERIYLVDSGIVEELVGDVAITEYEKSINNFVAYVVAMINYFKNTEPIMGNTSPLQSISRVGTFGVASLDPDKEVRFLFPLRTWQDAHYFYGIPAEQLEKNSALPRQIKKQTKKYSLPDTSVRFSVHPTTFDNIMVLASLYTKDVQMFPA